MVAVVVEDNAVVVVVVALAAVAAVVRALCSGTEGTRKRRDSGSLSTLHHSKSQA